VVLFYVFLSFSEVVRPLMAHPASSLFLFSYFCPNLPGMLHFEEKYINPFTDYGFKRLFGEVPNKDLLLDFLNELLRDEQGLITDLNYLKTDNFGSTDIDRRAIFDLYCENERGEKFIVELQKAKQNFFKDRTVFYSTFPIRDQAKRADWNYELKAVYTIAILDFVFEEDKAEPHKYRYDVKLTDIETKKVFYDKLTFIYLEMPKFNKTLDELETRFDKWLYVLKNLNRLDRVPDRLRERIFEKLFEVAEIARFTPEQMQSYEDSLKYYRDIKNSLDTAREEGFLEGELKSKIEIARKMLLQNMDVHIIATVTGLSHEQIEQLR
jgi:predicted transposase/invertase (TIGR01784 family)